MQLSQRYQLLHWDSLIIAAALQANCAVLYSEDLQSGMVIDQRLTIINPFSS
jgi:predicted nucleic acid-binding protein